MWRLSVLQLMFDSNKFNEESRQPPNDQINMYVLEKCDYSSA